MICGFNYRAMSVKDHLAEVWVGDTIYEVEVPFSDQDLTVTEDRKRLHVYHHINDRGQRLYGFETAQVRQLFIDLISVDSIGPSKAIKVLSSMEPDKVMCHIADGDVEALAQADGIGRKSAEKLVVDLRKKYEPTHGAKAPGKLQAVEMIGGPSTVMQDRIKDTLEATTLALVKLGYKKRAVTEVVKNLVLPQLTPDPLNMAIDFDEILSNLIRQGLTKLNQEQ